MHRMKHYICTSSLLNQEPTWSWMTLTILSPSELQAQLYILVMKSQPALQFVLLKTWSKRPLFILTSNHGWDLETSLAYCAYIDWGRKVACHEKTREQGEEIKQSSEGIMVAREKKSNLPAFTKGRRTPDSVNRMRRRTVVWGIASFRNQGAFWNVQTVWSLNEEAGFGG